MANKGGKVQLCELVKKLFPESYKQEMVLNSPATQCEVGVAMQSQMAKPVYGGSDPLPKGYAWAGAALKPLDSEYGVRAKEDNVGTYTVMITAIVLPSLFYLTPHGNVAVSISLDLLGMPSLLSWSLSRPFLLLSPLFSSFLLLPPPPSGARAGGQGRLFQLSRQDCAAFLFYLMLSVARSGVYCCVGSVGGVVLQGLSLRTSWLSLHALLNDGCGDRCPAAGLVWLCFRCCCRQRGR